jgi:hypothetical protein
MRHLMSLTNSNILMLYRKTTAVNSENYAVHVNKSIAKQGTFNAKNMTTVFENMGLCNQ